MRKPIVLFSVVVLMTSLASCGEKREAKPETAVDDQVKVLATVNGAPITEYDMKLHSKRAAVAAAGGASHELSQNVLQTLVRDELIYQKSIELGLDKKQQYRQRLMDVEAQFRAFKRQEMSRLYRRYVQEKAEVTDA
ncbi:MAG: hypothetical protein ABIH03_17375, partial [Pseudomonadota bacterium]